MADSCIHHWRIAMPDGPTSHGVCKRCGAEREFSNYDEGSIWRDGGHGLSEVAVAGFGRYARDRVESRSQVNTIWW